MEPRKRLGEVLLQMGLVTPEKIEEARDTTAWGAVKEGRVRPVEGALSELRSKR